MFSIKACFCCALSNALRLLMGLEPVGVDGLLMGTLASALFVDVADRSEALFFDLRGAMFDV